MAGLFGRSICVLTGLVLLTVPVAAGSANNADYSGWVWQPTEDCPDKPEEGAPGSSPDTAIPVKEFRELEEFAVFQVENEQAGGTLQGPDPDKFFEPRCKWVRLTGFFTWTDYYDYRGFLYKDAKDYYFYYPRTRYVVESYGLPSTRRGDLHHRRITLVGRFYDICADDLAAKAKKETSKETEEDILPIVFGGLCHYGDTNGLTLRHVFIEKVHDDAPRFLTGEENRDVVRELVPYTAKDAQSVVERTRAWAALVKSGPEAYSRNVKRLREQITDPDSFITYLSNSRAFRRLNTKTAQVAIFQYHWYAEPVSDDEFVGCICLVDDCAGKWPLLFRDSRYFLGAAACISLRR